MELIPEKLASRGENSKVFVPFCNINSTNWLDSRILTNKYPFSPTLKKENPETDWQNWKYIPIPPTWKNPRKMNKENRKKNCWKVI